MQDQPKSNLYQLGAFSADDMLGEIVDLRMRIVQAWRERAVMLTRDEQDRLLQEIKLTCQLLGDLAS
jgi:hypothetical protein